MTPTCLRRGRPQMTLCTGYTPEANSVSWKRGDAPSQVRTPPARARLFVDGVDEP